MFHVTILSKNKNSIKNFFLFLIKNKLYKKNNFKKHFQKKTKRKKITILKSPHVNKKAQERFEKRLLKKQFTIQTIQNLKKLVLLKKLKFNLFPDIKIVLKQNINKINTKKVSLKIFNPDNLNFNKNSNITIYNINLINVSNFKKKETVTKKTLYLIKFFDLYGEFLSHKFK